MAFILNLNIVENTSVWHLDFLKKAGKLGTFLSLPKWIAFDKV